MSTDAIRKELEQLAEQHDGLVTPGAVVERARDPESPLHDRFTWDDSEAAERWRLEEARQLLRVFVVERPAEGAFTPVRAFVSLSTDRAAGGGYRTLQSVMNDEQLRAQMLRDALVELRSFEQKYRQLERLSPVFRAVERVAAAVERKAAKGKDACVAKVA